MDWATDVVARDGVAYVAAPPDSTVYVVDVRDPTNMTLSDRLTGLVALRLALADELLLASFSGEPPRPGTTLAMLTLTDPVHPVALPPWRSFAAQDVLVAGERAYALTAEQRLHRLGNAQGGLLVDEGPVGPPHVKSAVADGAGVYVLTSSGQFGALDAFADDGDGAHIHVDVERLAAAADGLVYGLSDNIVQVLDVRDPWLSVKSGIMHLPDSVRAASADGDVACFLVGGRARRSERVALFVARVRQPDSPTRPFDSKCDELSQSEARPRLGMPPWDCARRP